MRIRTDWIVDGLAGFVGGGAIGAIVAVNVIITAGIEYHVTLAEVFRRNVLVGVLATLSLVGGPVGGIMSMRLLRRGRSSISA